MIYSGLLCAYKSHLIPSLYNMWDSDRSLSWSEQGPSWSCTFAPCKYNCAPPGGTPEGHSVYSHYTICYLFYIDIGLNSCLLAVDGKLIVCQILSWRMRKWSHSTNNVYRCKNAPALINVFPCHSPPTFTGDLNENFGGNMWSVGVTTCAVTVCAQ